MVVEFLQDDVGVVGLVDQVEDEGLGIFTHLCVLLPHHDQDPTRSFIPGLLDFGDQQLAESVAIELHGLHLDGLVGTTEEAGQHMEESK